MNQVDCNTQRIGPGTVLAQFAGEIDSATASGCLQQLRSAATAAPVPELLVVDLREVTFLAASGIAMLLQVDELCAGQDTRLALVADQASHLAKVLRMLKVPDQMPLHDTLEIALAEAGSASARELDRQGCPPHPVQDPARDPQGGPRIELRQVQHDTEREWNGRPARRQSGSPDRHGREQRADLQ